MHEFHVLSGMDEAGLGPILGPLVVGGMVLCGPSGQSPWDALHEHFCKKPSSRKDKRIRVNDSKKVKTGVHGHRELERTVLTLWYAVHGSIPASVGELLRASENCADLERYPWYAAMDDVPLPRWQERDALELEAHLAARSFERAGLRALAYPFHIVDVSKFNAMIRELDNKGKTLFGASVPVLRACLRETQAYRKDSEAHETPATLVADRHGARGHYGRLLERALPGVSVTPLVEASRLSRYRLGANTEIVFTENGEDRAFPCAAASCLAKYAREVCVERLNAFVAAKRPEIKPTAGYWTDGKRFLEDMGPLRTQLPEDLLVRIR